MAARRLLIVMLVLLGISTLAAALVPQHALRSRNPATSATTTTTATTTTAPPTAAGRSIPGKIHIGKQVPVIAKPVCGKRTPACEPIHVGDQLLLKVFSPQRQVELSIRSFGLFGIAAPNAPAHFQLLFDEPTSVGILDASTGQPVAKIVVLSRAAAKQAIAPKGAKSRARGG
jgi:hypothetical protein